MPITEGQARRALRHADIPWDREVDDPRDNAWVVHDHLGLLGGLAAAFSTGCRSLRRCATRWIICHAVAQFRTSATVSPSSSPSGTATLMAP
jgi:hypothetical protein